MKQLAYKNLFRESQGGHLQLCWGWGLQCHFLFVCWHAVGNSDGEDGEKLSGSVLHHCAVGILARSPRRCSGLARWMLWAPDPKQDKWVWTCGWEFSCSRYMSLSTWVMLSGFYWEENICAKQRFVRLKLLLIVQFDLNVYKELLNVFGRSFSVFWQKKAGGKGRGRGGTRLPTEQRALMQDSITRLWDDDLSWKSMLNWVQVPPQSNILTVGTITVSFYRWESWSLEMLISISWT